ncbi:hypothetical protein SAMD00019534_076980 [Acytostelium subglobosum LB1]|uniref:hypothetical protein n=1 Tax=Acytostelium subglobosum LB1 TaxID=1410327 RepID=UPI000645060C|nr:hypothetical protein SAMD00019534_076980 [Acytostelium subglobosum LB1]GAM24523.1 hypothetical protein SAMD00019534_076980 [Acytostelium subglobosum LB1]|eukprot:XP_012752849.1 hypothetical protein SAMD00019534_076980 [Acytostelium subglobosum LB1]
MKKTTGKRPFNDDEEEISSDADDIDIAKGRLDGMDGISVDDDDVIDLDKDDDNEDDEMDDIDMSNNKTTSTTTTTTSTTSTTSTVNNSSNNNNNDLMLLDNNNINGIVDTSNIWFMNDEETTRNKKYKLRSFNNFEQKFNAKTTIDNLFKHYFNEKRTLDQFILATYPHCGTVKCSNYLFRRWYFVCLTCSSVTTRFCIECFLNGKHREENHRYSLVYSPAISCLCDCGDADLMSPNAFCKNHRHGADVAMKERYINAFPKSLRAGFQTFFAKLIAIAVDMGATQKSYSIHESEISHIITHLGKAASLSPLFVHLIAEEFTQQQLSPQTFDLMNPIPLHAQQQLQQTATDQKRVQKRQRTTASSSSSNNNNNNTLAIDQPNMSSIGSNTPLGTLFTSHLDFSTKCFYLFAVLSYHHKQFGQVFFQHYLKHFTHLMRPQPRIAVAESCYHLQHFYLSPSSILIPFATGKSPLNLLQILVKHSKSTMDIMHAYCIKNNIMSLSYRFESKMFPRLMSNAQCATYLATNKPLLIGFLELCQFLHCFVTPAFKFDNVVRELKDLIHLEFCLVNSVNHMLANQQGADTRELTQFLIVTAMGLTNTIQYPPVHTHQTNKSRGSRLIFPLPRIVSLAVLHNKEENIEYYINLVRNTNYGTALNDTLFNISYFRVFYYAHCFGARGHNVEDSHVIATPSDVENYNGYFTQKTMMLDFFTLQLLLAAMGPREFLLKLIDDPFSTFSNKTSNIDLLKTIFELLINILQTRASLQLTDDQLRYHYVQAAASGFFYYTEMLDFGQMYSKVPLEKKRRILAEVCNDTTALKMTLKPELWNQYDPYYWGFEYSFKIRFLDRSRNNLLAYQKANNIAESHPWFPIQAPPLDDSLAGINRIFEETTLFELLHHIMMKILHTNFNYLKNLDHKVLNNHFLFGKISATSVVVMNDIFYLFLMALQHFDASCQTMGDAALSGIHKTIQEYFQIAESAKPSKRLNYDWRGNNAVVNILRAHSPSFSGVRKIQCTSILDSLLHYWKSNTDDQNPLLLSILKRLALFDTNIDHYIRAQGVVIHLQEQQEQQQKNNEDEEREARKLMLAKKKEEIMRQMREKQAQFLQKSSHQQLYDETDMLSPASSTTPDSTTNGGAATPPITSTTTTTTTTEANTSTTPTSTTTTTSTKLTTIPDQQPHVHEDDIKICMICRDRDNTSPLYTVARLTNCTLVMNQRMVALKQIHNDIPDSPIRQMIGTFLEHAATPSYKKNDDRNAFFDKRQLPPKVLKQFPLMSEFFASYYELPSYITSCLHYAHRSCISQSIQNYEFGFSCPLCSAQSNILVPIDVSNLTTEEMGRFFLNFQDHDIEEVYERHLWGMVYSNLEVFELKSRLMSEYAVDEKGPYYIMTDLEFKQELATLRLLFSTIISCEVPPYSEDMIPVDDNLLYGIDPFFMSTYLIYLRRHLDPKDTVFKGLQRYIFNFIVMRSLSTETKSHTQVATAIRATYKQLLGDDNGNDNNNNSDTISSSSSSGEQSLRRTLDNYLFPMHRKMYLFSCLANYKENPKLLNTLTLQSYSSWQFIADGLALPSLDKILDTDTLEDMIKSISQCKKNSIYIPSSYNHTPRFMHLPERYIDFVLRNIPKAVSEEPKHLCPQCERTKTFACMSCGELTCSSDCPYSFISHPKKCVNGLHQVFIFIDITTGLLKVVDLDRDVILYNNDSFSIYFNDRHEPSTMTNNSMTLSNKNLQQIYRKWIKMVPTNTLQSMDLDIPHFLNL